MTDAAAGARSALQVASWRATPHLVVTPGTAPGQHEIVVAVRCVAVNPIDGLSGVARRAVLPWLAYPAVLGSDVAGEVVALGAAVSRFQVGDRVLGHAAGVERSRNRAAEGAFQTHAVLLEHMTAPIPDVIAYTAAAVLPLALSTAAAGLFERDQLALALPAVDAVQRDETLLVWGGSTSVGLNAIQLARNAGYQVIATASPHNFPLLHHLGAATCFDYHRTEVVEQIVRHLQNRPLAGILAIGAGSLQQAIRISRSTVGAKRVASAYPTPQTRIRGVLARRQGVAVSAIWGGTPVESFVGPAIYAGFLPDALADGRYRPAPPPLVVGDGLTAIPAALERLRQGVSAQKLVVTL